MNRRILVTGASGFVGAALIRRLKETPGNMVITIRRDYIPSEPILEDVCLRGDITDYDLVRRAVADFEVDTIFHLASQSIVRICAADPVTAYNVNVMGTVNILEAVRSVGGGRVKSVVVSTSDKAFGHAPAPYTEETPLMPKYTYEATKACQDIVCQNYFHNYEVPVKIARFSNIYGPGDPNWSRLIPNTIRKIISGERPQLYTDVADYIREFVYIDDAVDGILLLDEKAPPGEIYCVGGTSVCKIDNLVKMILDICKSSLSIELIQKQAVFKEIETQYIDATKVKALGWNAKFSLEEGLKRTIEHYRKSVVSQ
ncbi:MAG: NAD(P)-dependent oxidoreductase [Candidatus Paceibacterota bacterium]|jgi:CDP-glucose 4,6-dehydratase